MTEKQRKSSHHHHACSNPIQSNPIPAVRNWRRAAVLIVMMIIIARFGLALIMIEAGDFPGLLDKLHAFIIIYLFLLTVRQPCALSCDDQPDRGSALPASDRLIGIRPWGVRFDSSLTCVGGLELVRARDRQGDPSPSHYSCPNGSPSTFFFTSPVHPIRSNKKKKSQVPTVSMDRTY